MAPAGEYLPATQLLQEFWPVLPWNLPAAQFAHALDPAAAYLPFAQRVHEVAIFGEYLPAAQVAQVPVLT